MLLSKPASILPFLLFAVFSKWAQSQEFAQHYKHEGHAIMKRMADADDGYEGHDLARVHLVEGQGQTLKRVNKRGLRTMFDTTEKTTKRNLLQLHLSSGSRINLVLKSAGNIGSDTLVSYLSGNERLARKRRGADCFSSGEVSDSTGKGLSAVSHCNGLFGFASSPGFQYYLHPVGEGRKRRDVGGSSYDIHVLWRRSDKSKNNSTISSTSDESHILIPHDKRSLLSRKNIDEDERDIKTVVIEMAMFSDAHYWQRLQQVFPGREDDFLFIRIAATQALFSNVAAVGYRIQIKLKLLEYWTEDPEEYKFIENLGKNMKSFCDYTRDKYFYDIKVLNTGVTKQPNGIVGLAYVRGICTKVNCFSSLALRLDAFVVYDHELGHTLGIGHPSSDKCPSELLPDAGFMGGGEPFNFSPCMKYQLSKFFESGRGQCVFDETSQTPSLKGFEKFSTVLPGQMKSPDAMCEVLAGPGYTYLPFGVSLGTPACQWMVCMDENEASPSFLRAHRFFSPIGFPCDDESFCVSRQCKTWKETTMVFDINRFRSLIHIPEWSTWSTRVSKCSRSCGTGIRTRRRKCQVNGFNMAPYCPGTAIKPELCNTKPCAGESTKPSDQRQIRGDEVCARFLKNGVKVDLKSASAYLPTYGEVTTQDAGVNVRMAHSRSCLLKCNRIPAKAEGSLDAIFPDGTPCYDTKRSKADILNLKIDLRCVRGYCTEFCGGDVDGCNGGKRGVGEDNATGEGSIAEDDESNADGEHIDGNDNNDEENGSTNYDGNSKENQNDEGNADGDHDII